MFLRAERRLGADPDLRRNMRVALARKAAGGPLAMPWHRTILFWHYGLGAPVRFAVAACAFLVFWLALSARVWVRARLLSALAGAAMAVFVLFASSYATSLQQEAAARRSWLAAPPAGPARSKPLR